MNTPPRGSHAAQVARIARAMDNMRPYQPTPMKCVYTVNAPDLLRGYLFEQGWIRAMHQPPQLIVMTRGEQRILWSPNISYGNWVVSFRGFSDDEARTMLAMVYEK